MVQLVSVVGALLVLGAFVANLGHWMDTSSIWYSLINLVGSGILMVVAIIDQQIGFILLEGVWALVSLWGLATVFWSGGATGPDH